MIIIICEFDSREEEAGGCPLTASSRYLSASVPALGCCCVTTETKREDGTGGGGKTFNAGEMCQTGLFSAVGSHRVSHQPNEITGIQFERSVLFTTTSSRLELHSDSARGTPAAMCANQSGASSSTTRTHGSTEERGKERRKEEERVEDG
ncbi:hypothetical protein EYF80_038509 [Liparis tanakae]|uniref:Uncharacterized protein n=1 Tax=Liparis tanakae TaxID=230148 RepID=A0A4Z2GDM2_9TELE|nr:hypothetical protein EYF80_038509 [Liparis tanakae]